MSLNNHNEKEGSEKINKEKLLPENLNDLYKDMPLTDDTTCGFWIFKGYFLQKFANKKAYVFLYGVVGCIFSATYAYFNGTITTIEKRYKIPSKNTGIISVGNDISQLFVSAILSYYAGKGHRPRWISFGIYTVVLFCIMTALPHILYGPGEDALSLTTEYGGIFDDNATQEVLEKQKMKTLCRTNVTGSDSECATEEGNLAPQILLFAAQFISGIGGSLYYTLGVSYMDDNIKKSKTPALISLSYFLRMLGPAIGYTLASVCLKMYISPSLTPTISNTDPRWLGAWWLGWFILGIVLLFFAFLLGLFPKILPRAAVRKRIALEKLRTNEKKQMNDNDDDDDLDEKKPSFKDMMITFKRLLSNTTLMLNNIASVFYFFGYMPYWIFTPKYIETQYRQSASVSSLVTGTIALVFSAVGVLLSGVVISKYKPRARYMAAWNVIVGALSVLGMISYAFLGCPANDSSIIATTQSESSIGTSCNAECFCDYVKYSPVCTEDGNTFVSACHAGCKQFYFDDKNQKIFNECSCVSIDYLKNKTEETFIKWNNVTNNVDDIIATTNQPTTTFIDRLISGGKATVGSCAVDCHKEFYLFLIVMCFLKFTGATGRASNFLVSVRCVAEKDKPVAMGFGLMLMSLFSFIPSPIFFGSILDKTCIVWGKTCTGKGNCWLYDGETLRNLLNITAAVFVAIGTLFDVGVWYYVKDLKIFDEEIKDTELQEAEADEEEQLAEKQ